MFQMPSAELATNLKMIVDNKTNCQLDETAGKCKHNLSLLVCVSIICIYLPSFLSSFLPFFLSFS